MFGQQRCCSAKSGQVWRHNCPCGMWTRLSWPLGSCCCGSVAPSRYSRAWCRDAGMVSKWNGGWTDIVTGFLSDIYSGPRSSLKIFQGADTVYIQYINLLCNYTFFAISTGYGGGGGGRLPRGDMPERKSSDSVMFFKRNTRRVLCQYQCIFWVHIMINLLYLQQCTKDILTVWLRIRFDWSLVR